MATTLTSPSLNLSKPPSPSLLAALSLRSKPQLSFSTRAAADDDSQPESPQSDEDPFESRLSRVRIRYRSGTGKKAEIRKSKKGKSKSSSGSGMYLPAVPLKEAVSNGLKVEFGFSSYSERINGRIAILGLTALLLVELATGKSVLNYHTPAIVFIQVYFVAAVSAVYIKYEKEKISVWPQSSPAKKE
ncbi:uncharacterized protein [Euphorbia lathyris]|uniref:uncharacterized protein n=1 Tax=Euphorbia lathyris TaxID=212925 RepID=UPI003313719C